MICLSAYAWAQPDPYNVFVSRLVAYYNESQFEHIYAQTAPAFQQKVTRDAFVSIFRSVQQTSGRFTQHRLAQEKGEQKTYYLVGERQSHVLTVTLDDQGRASTLFIRPETVPPENTAEADGRISKIMEQWRGDVRSKGLVVGVYRQGVYQVEYLGTIEKGKTVTPRENTIFELGSISKPLTGLILQAMIAEGKLTLSDPVNLFLPPDAQLPAVRGQPITLRHLVTHTSCLPRLPVDLASTMKGFDNPYRYYAPENLLRYLPTVALDCELGEEGVYSNLGAGLLGFVLTRASGKSYAQLVQHYIVSPLGTTGLGVFPPSEAWATGHNQFDQTQANWEFTDALVGAGGLDASPQAMKRLLGFIISPDHSLLGKAVTASTATQWKKQQELGTFWVAESLGGKKAHWHNGQTGGFNAFLGWIEGAQAGVFILSNQSGDIATRLGMAHLQRLSLDQ